MLRILTVLFRAPESRSVALAFALNSILFGNWFARIPQVQADLGLSDGMLGLALLGLPVGSMLLLPVSGWLVSRYGASRVTVAATLLLCAAIPALGLAGGLLGLFLALLLLGIGNGAQDVAMNAAAASIETRAGVSMMSSFHAMFSLGGILGAVMGSLAAGLGLAPLPHFLLLAGAGALLVLQRRDQWPEREPPGGEGAPVVALPRGPLLGLSLICFATMLGEGAAADWSAVYLLNDLGTGAVLAGLGYGFFAAGMTVGRLTGDALRDRLGEVRLVRGGALLGAVGLGLGLIVATPLPMVIGLTCLGLGLAGIVPIIFRRAATAPGFAPGVGLAAVASIGYAGFVCGPPAIGLLAEQVGLGPALAVVPLLALGVALAAGPAIRAASASDVEMRQSEPCQSTPTGPI
jgi:MFS family permease